MNKTRYRTLIVSMILWLMCTAAQGKVKYDDGVRGKFELRADGGVSVGMNEPDIAGLTNIGVGYNLTSHWYLGVGSGAYVKYGVVYLGDTKLAIPMLGELSYRWYIDEEEWSPVLNLRAGYMKNLMKDGLLDDGRPYSYGDYMLAEIDGGMDLRLQRNIDLRLTLGYGFAKAQPDAYEPHLCPNMHTMVVKVGVSLRGKPRTGSRQEVLRQENIERSRRQVEEERLRAEERRQRELEAEEKAREMREERRRQREGVTASQAAAGSMLYTSPDTATGTQTISESTSANTLASAQSEEQNPVSTSAQPSVDISKYQRFTRVTPRMMEKDYFSDTLAKLGLKASSGEVKQIVITGPVDKAEEVRALMRSQYFIDDTIVKCVGGETGDSKAVVVVYVR